MAKFVGVVPFTSDRGGLEVLRTALVSGVALALLAGLTIPADAAPRRMVYGGYGGYGGYSYGYPAYGYQICAYDDWGNPIPCSAYFGGY